MSKAANKHLQQVARKIAATLGNDFFHAMAKHLAGALLSDCLLIGEFVGGREERCRTVAAWMGNAPAEFEYALAGSATAAVALGKPILCRSNAQMRFPADTLLVSIGAHACVGVPLINRARHPIGVLLALFRHPVASTQPSRELLEIFASRASAELARKQEEEQLRESEQRYRAFIALNADAMWRIEFNPPVPVSLPEQEQLERIYQCGYIAECNDALARLLCRERSEQLIGCGVGEIAPLSDPSIRQATLIGIRSGHQLTSLETNPVDCHGNRRYFLRCQWGIVNDGRLERIWGSTRDITDLKHTETALQAAEQRMTDVLEAMHLLVMLLDPVLDPDGLIVFCNQCFYGLTGWAPSEVIGQNWLTKLIPEEQHARLQSELARGALSPDVPIHFESTFLAADGSRRQLACDSIVLKDGRGETAARAIIGRDITEFEALEQAFRQAQKLAAVGRLAGGVAHDFNNLLTVILGYASGLSDKLKPSDTAYIGLMEIRKAAEKGADLARSLLTFSRRQMLRPKTININSLVKDTEPMLATLMGAGIRIVTDLDSNAGCALLDVGYFHQVLLNLAINARDAMPRGGVLAIATSHAQIESPQPHAGGIPLGSYLLLTIADTGVGMTEDVCEHMFEPFFTTKAIGSGTGLGLSTVYGIVSQSGGHILVDTEVGHGTTFRIYLPRVDDDPVPPDSAQGLEMPRGSETILLLEDGDAVRKLTATILRELGYAVLEADGPARAIELIVQHSGDIHLLLASIGIPGLSVEELVDRTKALRPQMKVLFASGYSEAERPYRTAELGFGYLQKPFTPLALAVKVRELLDQK